MTDHIILVPKLVDDYCKKGKVKYRIPEKVDKYLAKKSVDYIIKNRKPISKQEVFNRAFLPLMLQVIKNDK